MSILYGAYAFKGSSFANHFKKCIEKTEPQLKSKNIDLSSAFKVLEKDDCVRTLNKKLTYVVDSYQDFLVKQCLIYIKLNLEDDPNNPNDPNDPDPNNQDNRNQLI